MKKRHVVADKLTIEEVNKFFALYKFIKDGCVELNISYSTAWNLMKGYSKPTVDLAYRMQERSFGKAKLENLLRPKINLKNS